MNWRMVLGLVLLAAAILSGWSAWKQRDVAEPDAPSSERPDYLMRNFEVISLDDQGQESITLRAPEMQRNPKDQTFTIATPLFLLPDSQGHHWEMRSRTAWVSARGDEMRLSGDVKGISPRETAVPSTFETQRLNVFPRKNLAVTDAAVTITRPGSILTGVGFETNTKTKQYTFKSQVKSRYEPNVAR
ncbi:MAG TPA: LPS export ABC transporter periplasmic protein LptC [Dongiaceae bacterium]|jgi:lipopolysaccharide export system protein LptC|nr:LPS export ABC transporter periplasmic protein LptC [Dongiaceae bacterium]